jgi:hypothetical protein
MAVTAHYINSAGALTEHLIAFRKIEGHHTGANVGQVLFSVLDEMGIVAKASKSLVTICGCVLMQFDAGQIGEITMDNASNNNALMTELKLAFESQGIEFDPEENRLQYICSIN